VTDGLIRPEQIDGDLGTLVTVTQVGHGFTDPTSSVCVVRHNGSQWVKAQANLPENAEAIWVVIEVVSADVFKIKKVGQIDITGWGLTAGTVYFLDPDTAGAITSTKPSTTGDIVVAVLYTHTVTEGELLHLIGYLVTSTVDPYTQQDLFDNDSTYIVVGDKTSDKVVLIDYSFQLPISGRQRNGRLTVSHDGSNTTIDEDYFYEEGDEITTVTFGAAISANELRVTIVTSSVGENPKLIYRTLILPIAA